MTKFGTIVLPVNEVNMIYSLFVLNYLADKVFTSGQNSPNFLGSFFSGLDSPELGGTAVGSNGNLYGGIAGSPESPINVFPTIFDIDVKMIPSKQMKESSSIIVVTEFYIHFSM